MKPFTGWFLGCTLGLGLVGCSSDGADRPVRKFLGDDRIRMLESSQVRAYRVDPERSAQGESADAQAGFFVTAEGPELSAAQRTVFRDLVFDEGNWDFDRAKSCEFMPGVALRFVNGDEVMVVLLCFSCDEWGFHHDGKTRIEDNDQARRPLIRLAQELFPDDPVVQKLH